MGDIFSDPKTLITGANEDIEDLERDFAAFFKKTPYTRVVEHDPKTGHETHKVKLTEKFPDRFSRRAAHAAGDLRSALDQAGYACAVAGGKAHPKSAYFPFGGTINELDDTIKRRCKDLPPQIATLFRAFNAHKGGDDLLWSLNKITNARKHRMIVPIGQDIGGVFSASFKCPGRIVEMGFPPIWDPVKNEAVLCIVGKGANPTYQLKLGFLVTFYKIDVVGGQPVTTVLRALSSKVQGIVSATEAEAKRTGLIQ